MRKMTPQQLKNSILQMAMQGKLVEQRPEEGTGEALYQEIQAEKKKLIQAGKIKKSKKLPEITEEEIPFEIPENWKWVRLGKLCEIARGGSPRPIKQYLTNSENGINWIKISDSQKGSKYITNTKEKIIPEGVAKSRFVHSGDFLLTNSMSFGRPYILKCDGCIHDGWLVITSYQKAYDRDFLFYLLSSPYAYYSFCNVVSGAVVKNLNSDKVRKAIFPLPPLSEQKRIVAKLEEIQPLLDRYEKAYNRLEAYNQKFPENLKKSILQYAIEGKLVEQRPEEGTGEALYQEIQAEKKKLIQAGKIKKSKKLPEITEDEIPFEIPESWKWVYYSDICTIINGDRGKNYPAKSTLTHSGIPFISAVNINGETVVEDDKLLCLSDEQYERLNSGKLRKDDIIVCIRGSLGKHGRYPFEKGAIASSLVICRLFIFNTVMIKYMMLFLDSPLFFDQIKKYDNGTAQPNLSAKSLHQFLIPLPPLEEQKRIVAKIEELMAMVEALEEEK